MNQQHPETTLTSLGTSSFEMDFSSLFQQYLVIMNIMHSRLKRKRTVQMLPAQSSNASSCDSMGMCQ